MRHIFVFILAFGISGCVSVSIDPLLVGPGKTVKALTAIKNIKQGMTREEVKNIMGGRLVIGYKVSEATSGAFEPIYAVIPYKIEKVIVSGDAYSINYYFTRIYKPDGLVSEEELTPVIFKNDVVDGKGWSAVHALEK